MFSLIRKLLFKVGHNFHRKKFQFQGKKSYFSLGNNSRIHPSVIIDNSFGGEITIGNNCTILEGVIIKTYGGNIELGNDCSINPYCVIYGHGGLKIHDKVRIATHTVIIPANHVFSDRNAPIYKQGLTTLGIVIGPDTWIGAGVKILDGVHIGEGVVIAAGSVVTKNLEAFGVYGGVPAKKIKER